MRLPKWLDNFCHNRGHCSCFIDGNWGVCCLVHDEDIKFNRTKTLAEADNKLFKCIWAKNKIVAVIAWLGVRSLSWLYWYKFLK